MTRLYHDCKCTVCKGWTKIANIGVGRNICDDYVCGSCRWEEIQRMDGLNDQAKWKLFGKNYGRSVK